MGGNVFTPPQVQDTQQITSIEQNTGDNSNSPSVGEPQEDEITNIDQNTDDISNLPSVGELQEDEPEDNEKKKRGVIGQKMDAPGTL
ncbi:hypothetical protein PRZ48_004646 [Zasmidium cellare]|uniref:Uncharacterized protein n=1 Tax=Zasmidium cellare TaxID=395010 RepID=A0ABR0EQ49_ZASCE|nr:hypothetical protein PRZ48_004646 [Zasmidium cellare]